MSRPSQILAALRLDGSVDIGTGHAMRCLALANALRLRGVRCVFFARALTEGLAAMIEAAGHCLMRLPAAGPAPGAEAGAYGGWLGTTQEYDAKAVADALAGERPLFFIVDHYALDARWEDLVRSATGARMMAIDDLSRRHTADIVLDSTFGKTAANYEGLVERYCVRLVGAAYAPLRPDFSRVRPASLARRDAAFAQGAPACDILVSMGGADAGDATGWVLDGLEPLARVHPLRLHVLVGAAYPHLARLEARAARSGADLRIHRDVHDMGEFLAGIDLAVGAGGTSAWERCCLGVPAVHLLLAENQRTVVHMLSQAGAAADGGDFRPETDAREWAARHITPLLEPQALEAASGRARTVTDGDGTQRVLSVLLSDVVRHGPFALRAAHIEDAGLLYEWQCDPRTRLHAVNPAVPGWEEHLSFMSDKLADPKAAFYVAEAGGIACGVVRLDVSSAEPPPVPAGAPWREISILTAPEFYGCGVASRALRALRARHGRETLVARVLDGNEASHRLFAGAGYSFYAPSLLMRRPETGNESE